MGEREDNSTFHQPVGAAIGRAAFGVFVGLVLFLSLFVLAGSAHDALTSTDLIWLTAFLVGAAVPVVVATLFLYCVAFGMCGREALRAARRSLQNAGNAASTVLAFMVLLSVFLIAIWAVRLRDDPAVVIVLGQDRPPAFWSLIASMTTAGAAIAVLLAAGRAATVAGGLIASGLHAAIAPVLPRPVPNVCLAALAIVIPAVVLQIVVFEMFRILPEPAALAIYEGAQWSSANENDLAEIRRSILGHGEHITIAPPTWLVSVGLLITASVMGRRWFASGAGGQGDQVGRAS